MDQAEQLARFIVGCARQVDIAETADDLRSLRLSLRSVVDSLEHSAAASRFPAVLEVGRQALGRIDWRLAGMPAESAD